MKMPMSCGCEALCDWQLPLRINEPRTDFPADWFKPKQAIANFFSNNLVDQWKAKIRVAEEFWQHQREEINERDANR